MWTRWRLFSRVIIKKNYKVIGADRRSSRNNYWRLKELKIFKKIIIEDFELTEINNIYNLFENIILMKFIILQLNHLLKHHFLPQLILLM